jgi:hypothetical protein
MLAFINNNKQAAKIFHKNFRSPTAAAFVVVQTSHQFNVKKNKIKLARKQKKLK